MQLEPLNFEIVYINTLQNRVWKIIYSTRNQEIEIQKSHLNHRIRSLHKWITKNLTRKTNSKSKTFPTAILLISLFTDEIPHHPNKLISAWNADRARKSPKSQQPHACATKRNNQPRGINEAGEIGDFPPYQNVARARHCSIRSGPPRSSSLARIQTKWRPKRVAIAAVARAQTQLATKHFFFLSSKTPRPMHARARALIRRVFL